MMLEVCINVSFFASDLELGMADVIGIDLRSAVDHRHLEAGPVGEIGERIRMLGARFEF